MSSSERQPEAKRQRIDQTNQSNSDDKMGSCNSGGKMEAEATAEGEFLELSCRARVACGSPETVSFFWRRRPRPELACWFLYLESLVGGMQKWA
jgi:hypothetical protein